MGKPKQTGETRHMCVSNVYKIITEEIEKKSSNLIAENILVIRWNSILYYVLY